MGQQVLDRDPRLVVPRKARKVEIDAISEPDPALFNQHHDRGRCCDGLGQRRKIEDRVGGHGLPDRYDRPLSVGLMKERPSAMPHENDGSGQVSVRNGPFDGVVDSPERGQVHCSRRDGLG